MHVKLFVLISVTLVIIELSHAYRVVNNIGQQHQPLHLSDNFYSNLDELNSGGGGGSDQTSNSLSDLLAKNRLNLDDGDQDDLEGDLDDEETDDQLDPSELLQLLPRAKSRLSPADYEYLTNPLAYSSSSSSSSSSSPSQIVTDPIVVDEEELESHSSLVGGQGHQYVSGGAGEGKQHLQPDGAIDNKEEVKSDEDLPAYCDPPNPCPLGVVADDCDPRPFEMFSAQFSKEYQEQQNCMCDDDHNECHKRSKNGGGPSDRVSDLINNLNDKLTQVVAKKSPRVRREVKSDQNETSGLRKKRLIKRNPYLTGQAIKIHVAKKSTNF